MDKLPEIKDLWCKLQCAQTPIVLYGMGDGADKILEICEKRSIHISGVFASDGFVRENKFHDWTVKSFSALEAELGKMIVLLAFGSTKQRVMDDIERIASRHEFYIPDVPVAGTELFDSAYLNSNIDKIMAVYDLLADEKSKEAYRNILYFKITGEHKYLKNCAVSREEMFGELFHWSNEEVFVDAGAYKGDTIEEFIKMTDGHYKKIYALEPDGKNYKKLKANTQEFACLRAIEGAAWNKDELLYFQPKSGRSGRVENGEPNTRGVVIDNITEDNIATYIKYDVEGAELEAIEGSTATIQKSYPKLLISVYHRSGDIFEIPLLIKRLAPEYKLYIRRNFGYPAWDINLICIKEN